MKNLTLRRLVRGALIAALYVALTLATYSFSFGFMQIRISEALTLLPVFIPEAIPALAVGCLLSNIVGGFGVPDMVFGTLATLLAAFLTSKIKNKWFAALPPVIINAFVIGIMLFVILKPDFSVWVSILSIGIGEAIACYVVGVPLMTFIEKSKLQKYFK